MKSNDALAGAVRYAECAYQAKKLHVIIVQPLRIALVEWRTIDLEVAFDEDVSPSFTSQQVPESTSPLLEECPEYGGLPITIVKRCSPP